LAIVLGLLAMAGLAGWFGWQLPPDPTLVTTLQDSGTGSLPWAITNAPPGSTITFDASLQGTINLTNWLPISKHLSIRGPGAGSLALNGSKNNESGVEVTSNCSVNITGLSFKSSSLYNEGTLTLINSTVSGNSNSNSLYNSGGGIGNWGRLTLINSTVSGNRTETSGGGIYNAPIGTLTLISSAVSGNLAA